ncbi:rcc01693 family protein [Rhodobacter lacus]|uniref:Rcc01693 family protein n=1 Tax=Rhodobacter lacus TaxID=1641972 RepID=A0ABW5ACF9_9RHOB
MAAALDWAGLMRAGIGGLKLRPAEFWALTPAELALLLGVGTAPTPMSRATLAALSRRWPDRAAQETGETDGAR